MPGASAKAFHRERKRILDALKTHGLGVREAYELVRRLGKLRQDERVRRVEDTLHTHPAPMSLLFGTSGKLTQEPLTPKQIGMLRRSKVIAGLATMRWPAGSEEHDRVDELLDRLHALWQRQQAPASGGRPGFSVAERTGWRKLHDERAWGSLPLRKAADALTKALPRRSISGGVETRPGLSTVMEELALHRKGEPPKPIRVARR